jgi:FkbM family methyltransferase
VANYYGQGGEDFLVDRMLEGQTSGFFVEVGCIDGLRFSNTLSFEERGWRGICIEAHPDYIEALRRNRPNSIVVHCAAGEADDPAATFYANPRGSLSSLDRSREQHFKEKYSDFFEGYQEQKVAKHRLDTLFDRLAVQEIDFLSLDIEGYEVQAISGLDLRRYRPRIMVIEVDSKAQEAELDALILPHDYHKSVRIGPNHFYLSEKSLDAPIRNRVFRVDAIHTQHPLDGGAPQRNRVVIDTRSCRGGWLRRLLERV